MILDPDISGYIRSFEPDLPDYLEKIENEGRKNGVPLIRKEGQSLLRYAVAAENPSSILEIGTAIGFSAVFMAYFAKNCNLLTSIEKDHERYISAVENIKNTNFNDIMELLEGDASEILEKLCDEGRKYDFVFLDAAKAQYPVYFESIQKLLNTGGTVLTDNVLQEGSVAGSKFSVTRRDRTIHMRMREFVEKVMKNDDFVSVLVPLGDGMLLCRKVK